MLERISLGTETLALKDDGVRAPEWYDLRRIMRESVFDFDDVVKVTHTMNCWYNSHCSYNAYVKDGVLLREEQPHQYPVPNDPECPDFNPKGCNKGCAWSHRTYDPFRLRHPLKRVGERGEGKWKRVSWEEALDDITDTMLDILVKDGPAAVHYDLGTANSTEYAQLGQALWNMRGVPKGHDNEEIGDDHLGATEFAGKACWTSSADDIFYTDLFIIWGGNPAYTAQAIYHYFLEARYRGAKVVVISPNYNATSPIADLWISVKPGSDAALALSMAQVIIEEGLHKEEFISEQTDMPLLVRMDNRKFLRETDIKRDGRDYVFYFWDKGGNNLTEAPFQTLALDGKKPAMEGEWEVQTLQGKVKVRPVMSIFKEKLNAEYTPEQASQITGVGPKLIRQFAREFATARGALNMSQSNFSKYYHGNIMERAQLYLWALCGHMGRKGATFSAFAGMWYVDKLMGTLIPMRSTDMPKMLVNHPKYPIWKAKGFDDERITREAVLERYENTVSNAMYHYFKSGLMDLSKKHNSWDPHLKRPVEEYLAEGIAVGKKRLNFNPSRQPKAFFSYGGDPFRRIRGNQYLVNNLLPKLRLLVSFDIRWNTTALYSDYVLPVASSYEQEGAMFYSVTLTPWLTYQGKAIEPGDEVKNDWWVWVSYYKRLSEKARERGIRTVTDPDLPGLEIRVDDFDTALTSGGMYDENDQEAMNRDSWETASNIQEILEGGFDEFAQKGYGQITHPGWLTGGNENAADITLGETFVPLTHHILDKKPWPTLTGRGQYYIDHDWYLELGEDFAWHKDALKAGGEYPIQITGGHTRWSIHTNHSDNPIMLRLQRGEPLMFMSDQDAEARGIKDGDRVEIYNDVGTSEIMAAVTPSMRPGMAAIYHGWTNFQQKGWKHFQHVMPTPFNPIEFSQANDDYPNLRMNNLMGRPGLNDRDTRVEVRKAG